MLEVIAPAPNLSDEVSEAGAGSRHAHCTELGVTGVLAVEMFIVDGEECQLSERARHASPQHGTLDYRGRSYVAV